MTRKKKSKQREHSSPAEKRKTSSQNLGGEGLGGSAACPQTPTSPPEMTHKKGILPSWKTIGAFAGGILTALTIIGILISSSADYDPARRQVKAWLNLIAPPKEQAGEVLIVIATFHHSEGVTDSEPYRKIQQTIIDESQKLDFANLRVEVAPDILTADDRDGANALGDRYDASLVIWGEDTGVEVRVNFYNHKQPEGVYAADVQLQETTRTQIAAPSEYAQFIMRDLPSQLTFLSLFAVGQSYYAEKDYARSVIVIEQAVTAFERQTGTTGDEDMIEGAVEAYFRLGWLYQATLDESEKALLNYTRAIELNSQDAIAYSNRGVTYYDLEQYDAALADFTRAIELNPQDAIAYYNRGNLYDGTQQYDAALADYGKAIEVSPKYIIAYNNRGVTHAEMQQYDAALADFTRVIELDPQNAGAHFNTARTHALQGHVTEACAWLDKAVALDEQLSEYTSIDAAFDDIRNEACFLALVGPEEPPVE